MWFKKFITIKKLIIAKSYSFISTNNIKTTILTYNKKTLTIEILLFKMTLII